MGETSSPAAPLPRTVRWFAPWTWSRRGRLTVIALLLVGYALAPPVFEYALRRPHRARPGDTPRRGGPTDKVVWQVYGITFWPLRWISRRSTTVRAIYAWERNGLIALFGSTTPLPFQLEIHRAGAVWAVSYGDRIHTDRESARVVDGQLTANGRYYGTVPEGATIVLEEDGRVLVNGQVRPPE
jgi:hypothetical protein